MTQKLNANLLRILSVSLVLLASHSALSNQDNKADSFEEAATSAQAQAGEGQLDEAKKTLVRALNNDGRECNPRTQLCGPPCMGCGD